MTIHSTLSDQTAPATPDFVVVTGMSGAGRSTAAHALEDLGWYVVDNLPASMLPQLAQLAAAPTSTISRLVAVVDARSRGFFDAFRGALTTLHGEGMRPKVIFIDANDESLVRRFESVRRPHPLQGEGRLLDGIHAERAKLTDLRADSDLVLDTSGLNVHQLSTKIRDIIGGEATTRLRIALVSFGFKYGVPLDADLVFDMRFLPNPYWIPALRNHTGRDEEVSNFVLSQPGATEFVERFAGLMEPMLAGYLSEGRRYITVAIGCTGGKHRSVAIAERLAQRLRTPEVATILFHRDLGRE
ncbi:RNase adapter RapZ [Austwickia sp. TVS 96-490-7B]|uniref:RNase adapter RapZ n=1 Tax=Austwickia sp. TVS 96-490-7B TaxID=2830843 RepID=UPI001C582B44|nr:RNase adapter RapZ [Austwickia sp. TVS 96-490-7B]